MIAITSRWDVIILHGHYHPQQMRTWDFSGNLIIVMTRGVQRGHYYLKRGCENKAWPLSPTTNANLGFLYELENCDGVRRTTW